MEPGHSDDEAWVRDFAAGPLKLAGHLEAGELVSPTGSTCRRSVPDRSGRTPTPRLDKAPALVEVPLTCLP